MFCLLLLRVHCLNQEDELALQVDSKGQPDSPSRREAQGKSSDDLLSLAEEKAAQPDARFTSFGMNSQLVAMNVLTTIASLTALKPLGMLAGFGSPSGETKKECTNHDTYWGVHVGVQKGGAYDATCCCFIFPLHMLAWVPMPICQVLATIGQLAWGQNILAIIPSTGMAPAAGAELPGWVGAMLFIFAMIELHVSAWRMVAFVPSLNHRYLLAAWSVLCTLFLARVATRAYHYSAVPMQKFYQVVTAKQELHFNKGNAWPADKMDPDDFDIVKVYEAYPFDSEGDSTWAGRKLDADGVHQLINDYLEKEKLTPVAVWLPVLCLVFGGVIAAAVLVPA